MLGTILCAVCYLVYVSTFTAAAIFGVLISVSVVAHWWATLNFSLLTHRGNSVVRALGY